MGTPQDHRQQLIDQASVLIQARNPGATITPLKEYVDAIYDDVYARVLLGRAYREDGQLASAIYSLQESLRFASQETNIRIIRDQINWLIGLHIQQSQDNNRPEDSIKLLEDLVQAPPYTPGYYIRLARLYENLQRFDEALRTLYYVQYDVDVGPQARTMIRDIAARG